MTEDNEESPGRGRPSKVSKLIGQYELEELGPEMERRWTKDENRWSLRALADDFNQRILKSVLEEANVQVLDGEVENTYRLLTDEEVSSAEKTRARRRLEREGIDVDRLVDDFVTYQAIRTYLTKQREVEYRSQETNSIQREVTNIEQLHGRVDSVVNGTLERLRNNGELTLGEYTTFVDVRVVCEDCDSQFDVLGLLESGGCECTR